MKQMTAALMCLLLIITFVGCSMEKTTIKEPVLFYYQRAEFAYYTDDSVIHAETREAAGHKQDFYYLLSNYLRGPTEEGLVSPFPAGTKLLSVRREENTIQIELSNTLHALSDSQFSLACACISLTCLNITDADTVTVLSGNQTLSTTKDSLVLFDESTVGYGNDLQADSQ